MSDNVHTVKGGDRRITGPGEGVWFAGHKLRPRFSERPRLRELRWRDRSGLSTFSSGLAFIYTYTH